MKLIEDFYLTIWDNNFNILGVIDTIESLEITKNLSTAGTLTLDLPLTPEHINLLKVGNLITASNNVRKGYVLEPYIIRYRELSVSKTGIQHLCIHANSLFIWFNQRILTQNYNLTNTVSNIVETLITNECISPQNQERIIPNLSVVAVSDINASTTFLPQNQYSSLSGAITSLLKNSYIGIQVLMNPSQHIYVTELFQGKNYSLGNPQGNSPIILGNELDNMNGESFSHGYGNFHNVAYVYGDVSGFENDSIHTDEGKQYVMQESESKNELEIIGETASSGLNRFEIGVDGSSPTINGKSFQLTSSNYRNIMKAVGEQTLLNSQITKNFAGKLNIHTDLQYRENFNVGDTITCLNKLWGIQENLVITSVTEEISVNGIELRLSFGYPLPTLLEKINLDY